LVWGESEENVLFRQSDRGAGGAVGAGAVHLPSFNISLEQKIAQWAA
jgi:hypothetical protein